MIIISISKGLSRISLDRVFNAKDGTVSGIEMIACILQESNALKKDIEINKFHKMLGHCGSDRFKMTAMIHGFKLVEEFLKRVRNAQFLKARQKNVKNEWK